MKQSVDKKGRNAEKTANKTKANLQQMLQLLGTVIDQIDDTEQLADVPILVVAGFVVVVDSSRHLLPPASQTGPAIPPIQIAVKPFYGLPQRIVKDGEQPAESCAICLGNYEQGESVITLPCAEGKHEFHAECIKAWFKQSNTCPLCREKISNTSNAVPVF
ncbi:hypothetical protein niasHT_013822 [Heterodera trifolii]|uniref:RING-type domain-containing protein n=1 Tax=Heterodera trifolii TaxID=157864 RepID=A0ABD2KTY3_9BILA